jgi:cytosine/adenosine deaminase-related metal-dependent hydrolase
LSFLLLLNKSIQLPPTSPILLRNLNSVESNRQESILIEGEVIKALTTGEEVTPYTTDRLELNFENALVFPGLINSHDHLDFNSFPQLGNKVYNNYVAWGRDIHKQNGDTINSVLKIPKALRIQWGIYKNLLNGITTVVNHGTKLETETTLLNIFEDCSVLHSVQFETSCCHTYWRGNG